MYVLAGWDYFDADEVGFKELYQLFSLAVNQLGQPPVVIDADDLLSQPGLHLVLLSTLFVVCFLQILFYRAYSEQYANGHVQLLLRLS